MTAPAPVKLFFLFLGDLVVLYASLVAALAIRLGSTGVIEPLAPHLYPFTLLFLIWLVVFYIVGLYDLRRLRRLLDLLKMLAAAVVVNTVLAVGFFYLLPVFGIAPKTSLVLVVIIAAILELAWRRIFQRLTIRGEPSSRALLLGSGETTDAVLAAVAEHPQLGYVIRLHLALAPTSLEELRGLVREKNINTVILPRHLHHDPILTRACYELLREGVEVQDLATVYELFFRKIPLMELEESWFLEFVASSHRLYDQLKGGIDLVAALLLTVILSPLGALAAVAVALTSRGPIFYRQTRTGRHGRPFTLYKFRSMYHSPERNPDAQATAPVWSGPRDPRITPVGRVLRFTHLDELPQLLNILRGELSFVGPRPERPEFVSLLIQEIPHFDIRHVLKPGITGWAQVNYPYGASVADAYEKLQYDLFYLKNRSPVLDLAVALNTLKLFFVGSQNKPR
ncbi:MAG: sugar transferase [Candidatus Liptonbacteria bacterium]|nr:sugar transferase [Candidatus Liptonbacteria bacterium]